MKRKDNTEQTLCLICQRYKFKSKSQLPRVSYVRGIHCV